MYDSSPYYSQALWILSSTSNPLEVHTITFQQNKRKKQPKTEILVEFVHLFNVPRDSLVSWTVASRKRSGRANKYAPQTNN